MRRPPGHRAGDHLRQQARQHPSSPTRAPASSAATPTPTPTATATCTWSARAERRRERPPRPVPAVHRRRALPGPDTDPDWWTSDDTNDRAAAQLACLRCPNREACLAWAIDHPTDAGDAICAHRSQGQSA
ncbi:WhiB family transcriptional regulator [Streptomyces sp. V1I1]|uniref:WhiB family transcriptional regulator n=1 Tax=Streptomyces sp. V1I1 TaxID=3042272 RepID=UPI00358EB215